MAAPTIKVQIKNPLLVSTELLYDMGLVYNWYKTWRKEGKVTHDKHLTDYCKFVNALKSAEAKEIVKSTIRDLHDIEYAEWIKFRVAMLEKLPFDLPATVRSVNIYFPPIKKAIKIPKPATTVQLFETAEKLVGHTFWATFPKLEIRSVNEDGVPNLELGVFYIPGSELDFNYDDGLDEE